MPIFTTHLLGSKASTIHVSVPVLYSTITQTPSFLYLFFQNGGALHFTLVLFYYGLSYSTSVTYTDTNRNLQNKKFRFVPKLSSESFLAYSFLHIPYLKKYTSKYTFSPLNTVHCTV